MNKAAIIIFALALGTCSKAPGTLEEILSSGQIRVVTRVSPTTFYRGADGNEGPEYQLVDGFAKFLSSKYGRSVEVVYEPVERFADLLPAVESRQSHFAAAGLTITTERQKRVTFGPSYQEVQQLLVYRMHSEKPKDFESLNGKRLEVVAGSSYAETLTDIQGSQAEFAWSENPNSDINELLTAVAERRIDYTVADSTSFDVHRHYMPELAVAMQLKESDQLAWAFRKNNSDAIRSEAHAYFASIRASGRLEQILDRYYGHTDKFNYVGTRIFIRQYDTRLVSYLAMFHEASRQTGADWRLLAAIGYQESHWDPTAVSPTGVRGLMMLTTNTANYMGVSNREDPEEAIPAGARYFAKLRERLADIPEPDRTWFALAAYNVGYGHVRDAQRIVRMQGGNPNRWLSVSEALPLLAQRKWYSQVPNGYARGWEPVKYVKNVRTYFEILNWLEPDTQTQYQQDNNSAPTEPPLQTAANDRSNNAT
jgi:membrane-bound lytic murein transglycosylase F